MKFIVKLSLALAILLPMNSLAQCRGYTKKECRPNLAPYVHDGKMNFAQLYAGDKAEIMLTFFAGQSYRLLVCCDQTFEDKSSFKIKDTDHNTVFDSEKAGEDYFDFNVSSTQQLIVEVKVPDKDRTTHELDFTGCVAIMVGVKNK